MSTNDGIYSGTSSGRDATIRAQLLSGLPLPSFDTLRGRHSKEKSKGPVQPSDTESFPAKLAVGKGAVVLPEQRFSFVLTPNGGFLRTDSEPPWPIIRISLNPETLGRMDISYSGDSVEAGVLHTRLLYALSVYQHCSVIASDGRTLLELLVEQASRENFETNLFLARIYRKLSFIEGLYRTSFALPNYFSASDIRNLEIAFRAITEGDFWSRTESITLFDLPPEESFAGPGQFIKTLSDPHFELLNRTLVLGPHAIRLDRSVMASNDLSELRYPGKAQRLIVLDSQINYRFENFARRSLQMRRQRLEQFKASLLKDEPSELAESIEEPLISDVSQDRARQIVTGWLQFYGFPDRYCPQDPILETNCWRVPIWVSFPNHSGALVQDAFVDVKTGVVTTSVSPEEIREIGRSVASQLLRAI